MSGGFFNLYLMLAAGVPLGFKRVVLDSTPILPNPASFVQFARAYMEDNGYELVNRVLPRKVHYSAVRLRWTFGSAYINLKHRLRTLKQLRDIKGEVRKVGDTWARNMSKALVRQDYSTLTEHALATVFDREGLESIFLFNPNGSLWTERSPLSPHSMDLNCSRTLSPISRRPIHQAGRYPNGY
jgi:hypothetical protein